MLQSMLGSEGVPSSDAAWKSQPPEAAPKVESAKAEPEAMTIRIFSLQRQQVGSSLFQARIAVLTKLLPLGSKVEMNPVANTVQITTTPLAMEGALAMISALENETQATSTAEVPAEVKEAIAKLSTASTEAARVMASMNAMRTDVEEKLANIDKGQTRMMVGGAVGGLILAIVLLAVIWLRGRKAPQPEMSKELTIVPTAELVAERISPEVKEMRDDVMNFLSAFAETAQLDRAAQEATHKRMVESALMLAEVKVQLGEVAKERQAVLQQNSQILHEAVAKFDEKTQTLATEQERVREIANELKRALEENQQYQARLAAAQELTAAKQAELEHERAKLAAVSLMLEEGQLPVFDTGATELPAHFQVLPDGVDSESSRVAIPPLSDDADPKPVVEAPTPVEAPPAPPAPALGLKLVPVESRPKPEQILDTPPAAIQPPLRPLPGIRFVPPDTPLIQEYHDDQREGTHG